MSTSPTEAPVARAEEVRITRDALVIDLADGRTIKAPLVWYPRLQRATPDERGNWRLIGAGVGIHWPDLDEDISIEGLLAGHASGESQESFKKWLDSRSPRRSNKRMQPTTRKPRRG
jgi:Protein of unknown function (DUF2442)